VVLQYDPSVKTRSIAARQLFQRVPPDRLSRVVENTRVAQRTGADPIGSIVEMKGKGIMGFGIQNHPPKTRINPLLLPA
jgi:hypothetical protein